MVETLDNLRCGQAPKDVLDHVNSLLLNEDIRLKAARHSRAVVPLHEDTTLLDLLKPWVTAVLRRRKTRKDVRLGRGPTAATMFPTCVGRIGRTGGGKLVAHQDFNPKDYPRQVAFSIVVLTRPVRTAADGPTIVYPGTKKMELDTKLRTRRLQSCTAIELVGEAGDAFIFDAADYHEVLPVRPPLRVGTRGISSRAPCAASASNDEVVRCNLVVGAWTAGMDNVFKFED